MDESFEVLSASAAQPPLTRRATTMAVSSQECLRNDCHREAQSAMAIQLDRFVVPQSATPAMTEFEDTPWR
jgi:hypothetical protein